MLFGIRLDLRTTSTYQFLVNFLSCIAITFHLSMDPEIGTSGSLLEVSILYCHLVYTLLYLMLENVGVG